MGSGENVVARRVDDLSFLLGVASPEEKDDSFAARRELGDDAVREAFPTLARVRGWGAWGHCQNGIQEEHSLLGPGSEVAGRRRLQIQVALQLGEDVAERRRLRDACGDRERKPHRLAGAVVWILTQDHHAHVVHRRQAKRIEDEWCGWVEPASGGDLSRQKRP